MVGVAVVAAAATTTTVVVAAAAAGGLSNGDGKQTISLEINELVGGSIVGEHGVGVVVCGR